MIVKKISFKNDVRPAQIIQANHVDINKNSQTKNMPWLQTQPKKKLVLQPKGRKASKSYNEAEYEKFLTFSELTDDPYWKTLINQIADNKLPKGYIFKNGYLIYKNNTKKCKRLQIHDDPETATKQIIDFFKETGGYRSNIDQSISARFESLQNESNKNMLVGEYKWSDIPKSMKDILIDEYINNFCRVNNLSRNNLLKMKTMVALGFMIGYLNNNSIVFVDGTVTNINGLRFSTNNNTFEFDNSVTFQRKNKAKLKIKSDELMFYPRDKYEHKNSLCYVDSWVKLIKTFDKRLAKSDDDKNSESYESNLDNGDSISI